MIETGRWFYSNKVKMDCQHITGVSSERGSIEVSLTKEQIEGAPAASEHPPVNEQRSNEGSYLSGTYSALQFPGYLDVMMPLTLIERPQPASEVEQHVKLLKSKGIDRHLRSAKEVERYSISVSNGELGPLSDMVVNTEQ